MIDNPANDPNNQTLVRAWWPRQFHSHYGLRQARDNSRARQCPIFMADELLCNLRAQISGIPFHPDYRPNEEQHF